MAGRGFLNSPTYTTYNHALSLKKAGNMGGNYTAAGTYYSDGEGWYTTNYSIGYDFNGGNTAGNGTISVTNGLNGYTLQSADLPTPTRTHYTFNHWCLTDGCKDESCEGVSVGDVLYGDTTLYAAWIANEYTMQFVNVLPGGTESATDIANVTFTVESTLELPVTPNAPDASYNFSGWFKADGTKIESILGSDFADEALINGIATVYAHWTGDVVYDVVFQTNNIHYPNSTTQVTDSLTLRDLTDKKNDVTYSKYFVGWFVDSDLTTAYTDWEQLKACEATGGVETQRTLYAKWEDKITITVTSSDDNDTSDGTYDAVYTIAFSETNSGETNSGGYFTSNTLTNEGGLWMIIPGHYVYLNATSSSSIEGIKNGDWTAVSADTTIAVNYDKTNSSSGGGCFTGDTLITLADGTQKKVEDVTVDDVILVFNHETGKYEAGKLWFMIHGELPADTYQVLNLQFSDGTILRIVHEHAVFDMTLKKYVYISIDNVNEFIGHKFLSSEYINGEFVNKDVVLVQATVTEELLKVYSPISENNLNCVAEGLLTATTSLFDLNEIINIFEYDEDAKYDEEKMAEDVAKYGIFSYEDLKDYISYETYMLSPIKYFKIGIEKGLFTYQNMYDLIEYLLSVDAIT